jgi:hypothetical protein
LFNEKVETKDKNEGSTPPKIAHAEDRQKERGVSDDSIEEAIENGIIKSGNKPNRTVYDLPSGQSSTGRGVRVVVDSETGVVITVIDKGRKYNPKP